MLKSNFIVISADFVRKFDKVDTNQKQLELGWFSISHIFIKDKIERRKSYGKWFKIQSNKRTIYRQLKFDPTLIGSGDDPEINLDWAGFIKLHDYEVDSNAKEITCKIKRANFFEILFANLNHPDQGLRAAYKLGLISLIFGLGSLFISLYQMK
jgi:hypothetical protein